MKRMIFAYYFLILILILLSGCATTDTSETEATFPTELPVETETATEPQYEITEINGQECFRWCQTCIPVSLGFPNMSEENAGTGKITTYPDALAAVRNKKYHITPTSEEIVQEIARNLGNHYEETGCIRLNGAETFYDLLYIKYDGIYYVLDPFAGLQTEGTWLADFPYVTGWGTDMDAICEEFSLRSEPEGVTVEYTTLFTNTPTFLHKGIEIPVGTGQPKLTNEEIDALISTEDYAYIAEQITTLADCVNYFVRADYCYGDGLVMSSSLLARNCVSCSAQQTMQRRVGQCASMSTAVNYLLWGDYDEVGYVAISGHAMSYILQDGIYYLVEPYDYGRQESYQVPGNRSISYVDFADVTSSGDFMQIAKGLIRNHGGSFVYTYSWPYSYKGIDPQRPQLHKESNPICWIGNPVVEESFDLTLYANDKFVDDRDIVMYPDPGLEEKDRYYIREIQKHYRGW